MAPYKNIVSYLGLSDEELAKPYEADSDFQPMTPRQILTYGVKECKKFGDTYDKCQPASDNSTRQLGKVGRGG